MTDQDSDFIRSFFRERSDVVLEADKRYLIESRLTPLVRELSLASITALVECLRAQPDNALHARVVELLVTGESSFFRDHHPFETLRRFVLPELIERRRRERRLNVWCAACSVGQEPYSLAILLREHFPELADWKVSLLATDLSQAALARAREGRYTQIEVNRGLPALLLVRYFQQHGTHWQLNAEVRGAVDFQQMNLARAWPLMPRMDLVLMRNVMIYFDVSTKKDILGRLAGQLRPDGYLLLGGAETTFQLHESYRRVEQFKSGFYQLIG
jgi:chemotaxis protein methyltransferase CheR